MEGILQAQSRKGNYDARKADETDKYIGRRIRRFRKLLGLSQTVLAESVGLSYQQIQKYETGANRLSGGRLYLIATVLGRNITDFFPPVIEKSSDQINPLEGPYDVERINNPHVRVCIKDMVKTIISLQTDTPREIL
ncbi:helix-turn-helix domain-containing protein [Eilatimonas milleporae]|uniref:Transcriptional regulator with XRE-family HTH domain n=1 Tax=Eilatimonas milleporae TaxID=911205 RepID=A0A3M0C5P7_9PROT|nr:helix-turn-helix transcriptional regulator [Eilatimonas milleporae]RMB05058.1 transcriptional regulator with XRE-family HTH domain [Eilatimonas milleporae]